MPQRALAFALTLMTAGVWLSPITAVVGSRQGQSLWRRTESQHFEIHFLPALAPELDRVVRSAEPQIGMLGRASMSAKVSSCCCAEGAVPMVRSGT